MVTPGDGLPLERRLLKEETRRKLLHPVGAVGRVQCTMGLDGGFFEVCCVNT